MFIRGGCLLPESMPDNAGKMCRMMLLNFVFRKHGCSSEHTVNVLKNGFVFVLNTQILFYGFRSAGSTR